QGHLHPVRHRFQEVDRPWRELRACERAQVYAGEVITAQVVRHPHNQHYYQCKQGDLEADAPALARRETRNLGARGRHRYFQRRLSTTRSVRNRKKTVRLKSSTTGRVSTIPRAKSCICSNKARLLKSSACHGEMPGTWSPRNPT